MLQTRSKTRSWMILAAIMSAMTMTAPTATAEKSSARYLLVHNCGSGMFNTVKLQKKFDNGFRTVNEARGVRANEAVCYDLSKVNAELDEDNEDAERAKAFATGDKARLRVRVGWGDAKNCDSTNVDLDSNQVRVMRVKGTTMNNNGCRSKRYRSKRGSDSCTGGGAVNYMSCH